jgi:hypothetical protein
LFDTILIKYVLNILLEQKINISFPFLNTIIITAASIIYLKNNPSISLEMGNNGRIAYEQYYSWNMMERRLLGLYKYLTSYSNISPNPVNVNKADIEK